MALSAEKKKKIGRLAAIIATGLVVLFTSLSIYAGVTLPTIYSFSGGENEQATSLSVDSHNLYYSTNTSVVKADENGNTVAAYNLVDDIHEREPSFSQINFVKGIYDVDDERLVAACELNQYGYLFLIDKESMRYTSYAQYQGRISRSAYDNDNFVISSYDGSMVKFSRYHLSTFDEGVVSEGILYNVKEKDNNVVLSCNRIANNLNLSIKGNNLYAISTTDITIMDLDFTYNNFHTAKVYEKWKDKSNVDPEFDAKYGFDDGDINQYSITLDYDKFDENTTYFNVDSQSIVGGFYNKRSDQFYFINASSKLNSIAAKDIVTKYPERNPASEKFIQYGNINFKDNVITSESCVFYNEKKQSAFIIFFASSNIAKLDVSGEEPALQYEFALEFNIKTIVQLEGSDKIYYLFSNKNKSGASGVLLGSYIEADKYASSLWKKGGLAAFIAVAVVMALVALILWLVNLKPNFAKKTKKTVRDVVSHRWCYIVMIPSLILLLMFCYYPAIASIGLSFFDYTRDVPAFNWNNFANYKYIFTDPKMLSSFKNMFLFLVVDIVTATIPPLIFAFFLTVMRPRKLSAVLRTLLFIPGIIPGIAGNLIWKEAILGDYGVINSLIQACGGSIIKFLRESSSARWAILFIGFPYVGSYLIFYGGMMNVPDSYYEAAELEGASPWRRFVQIDIPLVFPQIKYVIITSVISSVQNFARVQAVTNAADTDTYIPILLLYEDIQSGNYGRASAISSIIFIFLFAATYLTLKQRKKEMNV